MRIKHIVGLSVCLRTRKRSGIHGRRYRRGGGEGTGGEEEKVQEGRRRRYRRGGGECGGREVGKSRGGNGGERMMDEDR